MINPVDLRPDHIKVVHEILSANLPYTVSVHVFGSRALWTSKTHSDLDLALKADKQLSLSVMASLKEAFSESELPFKVDVVDWNSVPPDFQSVIDNTAAPLSIPLGEISKFLSGGTPSKKQARYWHGSTPWLSPKDMADWRGKTELHVTHEGLKNGTRLAPATAVFLAVRGMSLHKEIRVVFPETEMAFNQDVKAIVSDGTVTPAYLYYALLALKPALQAAVESSGHGTGTLPSHQLEKLLIPLFSQPTEEKISQLLKSLDQKIVLNQSMNETLEASARALFRDWFVDFGPTKAKMAGDTPYLASDLWSLFPDRLDDDGIPQGWQENPLDEIAHFLNGVALQKFPAMEGEPSLPAIKISELRSGVSNKSSRASLEVPDKYVIGDGDFIFSWSGSLLAKFWTHGKGALNQHLFKVTSAQFPSWFYSHWVWHHLEEFQRIAASKATTMGHIQRGHLKSALCIVPPAEALSVMSDIAQPLVDKLISNDHESRLLAQTRDLLLPKLMSGEIRVGEAEKTISGTA